MKLVKKINKKLMKQIANFIFNFINFIIECFVSGMCISVVISGGVCAILEDSFSQRIKWFLLAGIALYILLQMGMSITTRRKGTCGLKGYLNKEESR